MEDMEDIEALIRVLPQRAVKRLRRFVKALNQHNQEVSEKNRDTHIDFAIWMHERGPSGRALWGEGLVALTVPLEKLVEYFARKPADAR